MRFASRRGKSKRWEGGTRNVSGVRNENMGSRRCRAQFPDNARAVA